MWQILLITACLAQVSVDGAHAECDSLHAEVAELKQLLIETNERRDAKEAELEERIATNDKKLQEHIATTERKLHEGIAGLERRLDNEAETGDDPNPAVVSPYIYSAYGCFQDTISLFCPDARTIFVTSAIYGQFLQTCSHEGIACCPPNPIDDCVEDVETNNPQNWLAIKALCDNQTSCEFVNQGGYVPSCDAQSLIDYMQVHYQCLPENETLGAIAFTAYADAARDYGEHETILFNKVLSNFGGGYDSVSSMFTCPVSGVYVISLAVTTRVGEKLLEGQIFKEGTFYTSALADDDADGNSTGATTSVLSCEAGERVWVRSLFADSEMQGHGPSYRRSSISGFLLYAR